MEEKKKYIIVNEGIDFRRIAKIMTSAGFRMNHATARNQLMIAMENLFAQLGSQIGLKLDKKQVSSLIHSQSIHDVLGEVLWNAYHKKQNGSSKGKNNGSLKS